MVVLLLFCLYTNPKKGTLAKKTDTFWCTFWALLTCRRFSTWLTIFWLLFEGTLRQSNHANRNLIVRNPIGVNNAWHCQPLLRLLELASSLLKITQQKTTWTRKLPKTGEITPNCWSGRLICFCVSLDSFYPCADRERNTRAPLALAWAGRRAQMGIQCFLLMSWHAHTHTLTRIANIAAKQHGLGEEKRQSFQRF